MSEAVLRVLILDAPGATSQADVAEGKLTEAGQVETVRARDFSAAVRHLDNTPFDAVLLAVGDGDEALRPLAMLSRYRPCAAIVMLDADEARALQAVALGAQDCVDAGAIAAAALLRVLRFAVERKRRSLDAGEQLRRGGVAETAASVTHHLRNAVSPVAGLAGLVDATDSASVMRFQELVLYTVRRVADLADALDEVVEEGTAATVAHPAEPGRQMLDLERRAPLPAAV